jgi:hypothetical protein
LELKTLEKQQKTQYIQRKIERLAQQTGSFEYQKALQRNHPLLQPYSSSAAVATEMLQDMVQLHRAMQQDIQNRKPANDHTNDTKSDSNNWRLQAQEAVLSSQHALEQFKSNFPNHKIDQTPTNLSLLPLTEEDVRKQLEYSASVRASFQKTFGHLA